MLSGNENYRCNLPGKFKKEFGLKKDKTFILDVAVVGDRVDFQLDKTGTGTITKIHKRKNILSRKAPRLKGASFRGERLEQIIAANIEQVFIVASVDEPKFNNRLIDRFLVIAESSSIFPIIIINKSDIQNNEVKKFYELYAGLGYKILQTSTLANENIVELKNLMFQKVSIFWGASGVGKSSLISKAFPNFDLRIGSISDFSNKGKHTTVTVQMLKLDQDSFVIDTPGVREVDPFGIQAKDLGHYFVEFRDNLLNCRFNTCTHEHEPGCAVREAVVSGLISRERYQSYLNLLNTVEDDILF